MHEDHLGKMLKLEVEDSVTCNASWRMEDHAIRAPENIKQCTGIQARPLRLPALLTFRASDWRLLQIQKITNVRKTRTVIEKN